MKPIFDDCERYMREALNRAREYSDVIGTADYVLAETTSKHSCWQAIIKKHRPELINRLQVKELFDRTSQNVPASWLEAVPLEDQSVTQEFNLAWVTFQSKRAIEQPMHYFSEQALFDYCIVSCEETVVAVAFQEILQMEPLELTRYLYEHTFFPRNV